MRGFWLGLTLAAASAVAYGAGSTSGQASAPAPVRVQTPEQVADGHYRAGVRYRNRAWKLEAKAAAAANEGKRGKLEARAEKTYGKAISRQQQALKANPRHHEAANELGYALRKTGRFEEALQWYDYALDLQPGFLPAIEYRGEAYLALGRLAEAREAYLTLFRADRALAGQLMDAMTAWLAAAADPPAEFAAWVSERKTLADLSGDVSGGNAGGW